MNIDHDSMGKVHLQMQLIKEYNFNHADDIKDQIELLLELAHRAASSKGVVGEPSAVPFSQGFLERFTLRYPPELYNHDSGYPPTHLKDQILLLEAGRMYDTNVVFNFIYGACEQLLNTIRKPAVFH